MIIVITEFFRDNLNVLTVGVLASALFWIIQTLITLLVTRLFPKYSNHFRRKEYFRLRRKILRLRFHIAKPNIFFSRQLTELAYMIICTSIALYTFNYLFFLDIAYNLRTHIPSDLVEVPESLALFFRPITPVSGFAYAIAITTPFPFLFFYLSFLFLSRILERHRSFSRPEASETLLISRIERIKNYQDFMSDSDRKNLFGREFYSTE